VLVTNQRARIQLTSALIFHHTQILQYASAEEHLREFRRTAQKAGLDPLVRLQLALAESLFHCYRPDMDACHRAVEEGLRLAAETGFGLMNGHFAIFGMNAAVFVGDRPSAERYHAVARQSARPTAFMLGFLRWAESWFQREFGPPLEALRAANEALEIARRCSFGSWTPLTHQAVASAEMALGRYQEAAKQLEAARDHGRNGDLPAHIEISQLVLEALLTRTSQPAGPWRERLAAALRISRERRFPVAACVPRALQAELCAAALAEGIEQEWVTEVIALLRLRPPPGLAPETAWPWPIKIHTLGRFDVHIDDRLLRFRGKVPRVPLRLLKALLASGSHPTPQEVLCDALWPDADGDTAAQSLDTALHRLRRLLGRQDAILVAENRVRLNLEVVWADCLAIPLLAAQVERAVAQREAHSTVQALVQSLLPLLQGPFLPEDDDLPGVAATRERLRRSLSRLPRSASLDTETTGRASVSHL